LIKTAEDTAHYLKAAVVQARLNEKTGHYRKYFEFCVVFYTDWFLQRVSIACYAERCISHDRFCLTV